MPTPPPRPPPPKSKPPPKHSSPAPSAAPSPASPALCSNRSPATPKKAPPAVPQRPSVSSAPRLRHTRAARAVPAAHGDTPSGLLHDGGSSEAAVSQNDASSAADGASAVRLPLASHALVSTFAADGGAVGPPPRSAAKHDAHAHGTRGSVKPAAQADYSSQETGENAASVSVAEERAPESHSQSAELAEAVREGDTTPLAPACDIAGSPGPAYAARVEELQAEGVPERKEETEEGQDEDEDEDEDEKRAAGMAAKTLSTAFRRPQPASAQSPPVAVASQAPSTVAAASPEAPRRQPPKRPPVPTRPAAAAASSARPSTESGHHNAPATAATRMGSAPHAGTAAHPPTPARPQPTQTTIRQPQAQTATRAPRSDTAVSSSQPQESQHSTLRPQSLSQSLSQSQAQFQPQAQQRAPGTQAVRPKGEARIVREQSPAAAWHNVPKSDPVYQHGPWWNAPRQAQWKVLLPELGSLAAWNASSEMCNGHTTHEFTIRDGQGGAVHIRVSTAPGGQVKSIAKKIEAPPPPLDAGALMTAHARFGRSIVDFCQAHSGQQVGNGECWTLASEALKAAGARHAMGYNFGQVIPLEEGQPGDILQFQQCTFSWTTPNGGSMRVTAGSPAHTAIITGNPKGPRQFDVLEQNVGGRRFVQQGHYDFATMTAGTVECWRAVCPHD